MSATPQQPAGKPERFVAVLPPWIFACPAGGEGRSGQRMNGRTSAHFPSTLDPSPRRRQSTEHATIALPHQRPAHVRFCKMSFSRRKRGPGPKTVSEGRPFKSNKASSGPNEAFVGSNEAFIGSNEASVAPDEASFESNKASSDPEEATNGPNVASSGPNEATVEPTEASGGPCPGATGRACSPAL